MEVFVDTFEEGRIVEEKSLPDGVVIHVPIDKGLEFTLLWYGVRQTTCEIARLTEICEKLKNEFLKENVPYPFETVESEKTIPVEFDRSLLETALKEYDEKPATELHLTFGSSFIRILENEYIKVTGVDPGEVPREVVREIPPMLEAACPDCERLLDHNIYDEDSQDTPCYKCERDVHVSEWEWFSPEPDPTYIGSQPDNPPEPDSAACPNCGSGLIAPFEERDEKFWCDECFGRWWLEECHHIDSVEYQDDIVEEHRWGIQEKHNGKFVVPGTDFECDSLMEAEFLRLLLKLEVDVEREPEWFQIDGGHYVPDFRIGDVIVEVKGFKHPDMKAGAIRKGEQFQKHYPEYTYIVVGTPETECIPCDYWFSWKNRWEARDFITELSNQDETR